MSAGLVHPAATGQRGPQVEMGLGVVRLGLQGLPVMVDRFVDASATDQQCARLQWASA